MFVTHSAPAHKLWPGHAAPVAAIVYADEAYPDAIFRTLVKRCRELGMSLAGVVQHQAFEGGDRRCDVVLEDLTTGHRTALFENRGPGRAAAVWTRRRWRKPRRGSREVLRMRRSWLSSTSLARSSATAVDCAI